MVFTSNAERGTPLEEGTVFKAEYKTVEISVHRLEDYDGWFLSCEALGFQDVELESASPFSAILESQRLIERRMETAQMIVKAFHERDTDIMRG